MMLRMREIRRPSAHDLDLLRGIEAAADDLFTGFLGPDPFGPDSATDGRVRAREPGYLLVVAEEAGAEAIGFAHVLEPPELAGTGICHLEQLAVLPAHLRRGHGRALVEAACARRHIGAGPR